MKKILIISPHFPPSNLAGVHRARLFAQHLPSFGWEPVILTVHENFYEEALDHNLEKLLPPGLRVEKVNAFRVTKPRLIGDIGLRGFFQLYKRAKELIGKENFDFLYISVPSFYCALLGRWLHHSTNIRYGIDYIDPWVHHFPGSDKLFSRHWFSTKIAGILEPMSVKNAALITGVAEGYYSTVFDRNPHLKSQALFGAMPYGGEVADHQLVNELKPGTRLFNKIPGKMLMVYAGAMLPKAYEPLEAVFKAIVNEKEVFANVEFHFIGTGSRANDAESYTIKSLAERYGLFNSVIFEHPGRIPYLDVLRHINQADAVFILGSTEPHYTPSKVYQAILSGKPVLAVLHHDSSAVQVIEESKGGMIFTFNGANDLDKITAVFAEFFTCFKAFVHSFDQNEVNKSAFNNYSAENVTKQLATLLDKILLQK
ncbi:MAG: hypothetical protein ABIN01_17210 [Ferruginibacter sp.]